MSAEPADGTALRTSWVAHLRAGGTTPWPRWVGGAGDAPVRRPPTGSSGIPGAAQLELLRLLNEREAVPHLADHVLDRPGPGRGPVHLELPLTGGRPPAPRREVIRVAGGVLADLTAQLPAPRPGRRRRRGRRPRPVEGLPSFVLEGPPVTVAEVRARLAAAGLVEHRSRRGRRDQGPELAVVLLAPLDEALRQAWSGRVQRGAGRAWPRFVAQWAGRGTLPPSAAVDRTVDHWAERVGQGNVHLLPVDPAAETAPGSEIAARVADVLGHPLPTSSGSDVAEPPAVAPEDPVRLVPVAVDVLRRVNVVLPFVCPQADRAARRTALLGLLAGLDGRRDPVGLPARQRGWADVTAGRVVDSLQGRGCTVHGELAALRGVGPATGDAQDRRLGGEEVLDAMVRMIHRVDAVLVGGTRDGRGGR